MSVCLSAIVTEAMQIAAGEHCADNGIVTRRAEMEPQRSGGPVLRSATERDAPNKFLKIKDRRGAVTMSRIESQSHLETMRFPSECFTSSCGVARLLGLTLHNRYVPQAPCGKTIA
jgi:hypothetical protein